MTKSVGKHSVRENKRLEFITLRDGRKIVKPPGGGKLKIRDIERAFKSVASERRAKLSDPLG